jgi:hypothetical protein
MSARSGDWLAAGNRTSSGWRCAEVTLAAGPDFQELMSFVGHLLLRWGWVEDRLGGGPVPSELDHVRHIRNALSHRMISARADHEGGEAYVSCRVPDGTVVQYSATDLQEAIRELEKLGHRYGAR